MYQFTFPSTVWEGSLFSSSSPAFTVCRFFDDGHSDQCEVISFCSFDLYFSNNEHCWTFFRVCWPSVCLLWRSIHLGLLSIKKHIYLVAPGLSCGMWALVPRPEISLGLLLWECRVLATGPQGKSPSAHFFIGLFVFLILNCMSCLYTYRTYDTGWWL